MTAHIGRADDPIVPEILRTQLEAICQEAGSAVEQTAISPIVTESKDYSVTILDGNGAVLSGHSVMELQFGLAMHAVRSTIAAHGDTIAAGDVFIANDPHSGGGAHPQDVVIQRPVFFQGWRVGWVALHAHMVDMGGMVPGSSAVKATECYQEALRLPPVRLIRQGEEVSDVWNIIRINIRSADLVEMDIRSLVLGGGVAERRLVELIAEMGVYQFRSASRTLIAQSLAVLRARITEIEDGEYVSIARVEYHNSLLRIACRMTVKGDLLTFDLTDAPPQIPHFFNSKLYILRGVIAPQLRELLAPGLSINQAFYDVIDIVTKPGTLVDSVMPAPIAAAHMDATMAVNAAAWQCLQLAIYASPKAFGREYITAPVAAAYGIGRWNYLDGSGQRRIYTVLEGSLCGSPAGNDRDGIDLKTTITGLGSRMELADVEILEAAYPILFRSRGSATGAHGYGKFRSGAGCTEAFGTHRVEEFIGNLTGTKAWFPAAGAAGGLPGTTMSYSVTRADGNVERLHLQTVGVRLAPGDCFELRCASGGGFGDPLDRDPLEVDADLQGGRIDRTIAEEVYGVVVASSGGIEVAATDMRRRAMRRDRLARAQPAKSPPLRSDLIEPDNTTTLPLYPGVIQRGNHALAELSGALLAVSPGNWLDGCPVLDTAIDDRAGPLVLRQHLDPLVGRILYADVTFSGESPSIEIRPFRWINSQVKPRESSDLPLQEASQWKRPVKAGPEGRT